MFPDQSRSPSPVARAYVNALPATAYAASSAPVDTNEFNPFGTQTTVDTKAFTPFDFQTATMPALEKERETKETGRPDLNPSARKRMYTGKRTAPPAVKPEQTSTGSFDAAVGTVANANPSASHATVMAAVRSPSRASDMITPRFGDSPVTTIDTKPNISTPVLVKLEGESDTEARQRKRAEELKAKPKQKTTRGSSHPKRDPVEELIAESKKLSVSNNSEPEAAAVQPPLNVKAGAQNFAIQMISTFENGVPDVASFYNQESNRQQYPLSAVLPEFRKGVIPGKVTGMDSVPAESASDLKKISTAVNAGVVSTVDINTFIPPELICEYSKMRSATLVSVKLESILKMTPLRDEVTWEQTLNIPELQFINRFIFKAYVKGSYKTLYKFMLVEAIPIFVAGVYDWSKITGSIGRTVTPKNELSRQSLIKAWGYTQCLIKASTVQAIEDEVNTAVKKEVATIKVDMKIALDAKDVEIAKLQHQLNQVRSQPFMLNSGGCVIADHKDMVQANARLNQKYKEECEAHRINNERSVFILNTLKKTIQFFHLNQQMVELEKKLIQFVGPNSAYDLLLPQMGFIVPKVAYVSTPSISASSSSSSSSSSAK